MYICFHWFACNCSGGSTCLKENFEKEWELLRKVHGAYRYEIIWQD